MRAEDAMNTMKSLRLTGIRRPFSMALDAFVGVCVAAVMGKVLKHGVTQFLPQYPEALDAAWALGGIIGTLIYLRARRHLLGQAATF